MKNKSVMLKSIMREMELQREYLAGENISSVYFGGGTPSVLSGDEVRLLLAKAQSMFSIQEDAEITLEANPDDLSPQYLANLKEAGINRLSIGVQSFFYDDLVWMNRRHSAAAALACIENSFRVGFKDINIDLIYGLPNADTGEWQRNLELFLKTGVCHLSAYNLTLEDKTVYSYKVRKGLMKGPDDNRAAEQYELLMDMTSEAGFVHYEISNFCLPERFSRHNTGYWLQKKYLGIGPSANSYNGTSRQWNVRNNTLYIKNINNGHLHFRKEELDTETRYNEYIMTSLRTMWGVDTVYAERTFGKVCAEYLKAESDRLIKRGLLQKQGSSLVLSRRAKFLADGIIAGLFITRE